MNPRHPAFNVVNGKENEGLKPFLGKDELFELKEEIISQFPIRFNNYYEPFLTHGSIFFNLYNHKRIFNEAYLSTTDKDIINAYKSVAECPDRIEKVLIHCCSRNTKDFYQHMLPLKASPATLIYLYRAGYPKGWRENDFIRWRRPISKDVESIYRCSDYLEEWCAAVTLSNWKDSLMSVKEGDVVFLDPQDFSLGPDGFVDDKWKQLYSFCRALKNTRKCHVFIWHGAILERL